LLPSINDRLARSGVSFDPTALAMAGSKMPGNHSLVRITF
jgi:hypothetical protein